MAYSFNFGSSPDQSWRYRYTGPEGPYKILTESTLASTPQLSPEQQCLGQGGTWDPVKGVCILPNGTATSAPITAGGPASVEDLAGQATQIYNPDIDYEDAWWSPTGQQWVGVLPDDTRSASDFRLGASHRATDFASAYALPEGPSALKENEGESVASVGYDIGQVDPRLAQAAGYTKQASIDNALKNGHWGVAYQLGATPEEISGAGGPDLRSTGNPIADKLLGTVSNLIGNSSVGQFLQLVSGKSIDQLVGDEVAQKAITNFYEDWAQENELQDDQLGFDRDAVIQNIGEEFNVTDYQANLIAREAMRLAQQEGFTIDEALDKVFDEGVDHLNIETAAPANVGKVYNEEGERVNPILTREDQGREDEFGRRLGDAGYETAEASRQRKDRLAQFKKEDEEFEKKEAEIRKKEAEEAKQAAKKVKKDDKDDFHKKIHQQNVERSRERKREHKASQVARSEGSGNKRTINGKETFASKVRRGGGFNTGGMVGYNTGGLTKRKMGSHSVGYNCGGMVDEEMNFNRGGSVPVFKNDGGLQNHPYDREGQEFDTVPAMLTEGEFVIDADSTHTFKPVLEEMNEWEPGDSVEDAIEAVRRGLHKLEARADEIHEEASMYNRGGPVRHYNDGDVVDPLAQRQAEILQLGQDRADAYRQAGQTRAGGYGAQAAAGLLGSTGLRTTSSGGFGTGGYRAANFAQQAPYRGEGLAEAANARASAEEKAADAIYRSEQDALNLIEETGDDEQASKDLIVLALEAGELLQSASLAGDLINGFIHTEEVKQAEENDLRGIWNRVKDVGASVANVGAAAFSQTAKVREEARERLAYKLYPESFSAYTQLVAIANKMVFPILSTGALGVNPTDADVELARASQFNVNAPSSTWADQLNALINRNGGVGDIPPVQTENVAQPEEVEEAIVEVEEEGPEAEESTSVTDTVVETGKDVFDKIKRGLDRDVVEEAVEEEVEASPEDEEEETKLERWRRLARKRVEAHNG